MKTLTKISKIAENYHLFAFSLTNLWLKFKKWIWKHLPKSIKSIYHLFTSSLVNLWLKLKRKFKKKLTQTIKLQKIIIYLLPLWLIYGWNENLFTWPAHTTLLQFPPRTVQTGWALWHWKWIPSVAAWNIKQLAEVPGVARAEILNTFFQSSQWTNN